LDIVKIKILEIYIYIYIYTCTLSVTVCVSGYFNELILSVVIFETKQSWGEQNYQAEELLELYYHFRHAYTSFLSEVIRCSCKKCEGRFGLIIVDVGVIFIQ
jgi:hypothetical protein